MVEEQENLLRRMVIGRWIVIMLVLFAGASIINRIQRQLPQPEPLRSINTHSC
jgi:hypothetical protein